MNIKEFINGLSSKNTRFRIDYFENRNKVDYKKYPKCIDKQYLPSTVSYDVQVSYPKNGAKTHVKILSYKSESDLSESEVQNACEVLKTKIKDFQE